MGSHVLWLLDNETDDRAFERLCTSLMYRWGYRKIIPIGRTSDRGRDAEAEIALGEGRNTERVFFQFTLERRWEPKLTKNLRKFAAMVIRLTRSFSSRECRSPARNATSICGPSWRRMGGNLKSSSANGYATNLRRLTHPWLACTFPRRPSPPAARRHRLRYFLHQNPTRRRPFGAPSHKAIANRRSRDSDAFSPTNHPKHPRTRFGRPWLGATIAYSTIEMHSIALNKPF